MGVWQMSDSDERIHPPELENPHTGYSNRRRFVKAAALGVPAVLTLRSGGLAALSTPCRDRIENLDEVMNDPEGSCALSGLT